MKQLQPYLDRILPRSIRQKLIRGLGIGVGTRVVVLLQHMIIAQFLGVTGYGTFVFITSLGTTIGQISSLGWSSASVRLLPQYKNNGSHGLLRGFLIRSEEVIWGTSIFASVIGYWVAKAFSNSDLTSSVLVACVIVPILALRSHRRMQLVGLGKAEAAMGLDEGLIALFIVGGVLATSVSTANGVMVVYVIAVVLTTAIASGLILKDLGGLIGKTTSSFRTKEWSLIAAPLLLAAGGKLLMNRVDVLMIAPLVDADAVGLYSVSVRVCFGLSFLPVVVGMMMSSSFTAHFYGKEFSELKRLFYQSTAFCIVGAIPVAFVLAIFARPLLALLFGNEFGDAEVLLRVLLVGQFFNAITGPVSVFLVAIGRQAQYGLVVGIMLAINVVLNIILLPIFGVIGAAVATSLVQVAMNAFQLFQVTKILKGSVQDDTGN